MNDEIVNSILENLKNMIQYNPLDENKIKLAIKIQIRKCLNYMNREDFPKELIEPLAEAMALDYSKDNDTEIKSIQAGDTKIDYNTSTSKKDIIATSMKEQLRRFRKVGVINGSVRKLC